MAASSFREWLEDRRVYEEDGGVCIGEAIWNAALRSVEAKILQSGEAPVQQLKAEICSTCGYFPCVNRKQFEGTVITHCTQYYKLSAV